MSEPTRYFYLHRVYLNAGGYDSYGSYWGNEHPDGALYRYESESGVHVVDYVRAWNRISAKARVRERWPEAKFYR